MRGTRYNSLPLLVGSIKIFNTMQALYSVSVDTQLLQIADYIKYGGRFVTSAESEK